MHQYKLHFLVIFLFTSFSIKASAKHNLNIFFEFPVKNNYEMEFIENVKLIKIQEKIKNGDTISVSANDFGLEFKT